MSSAILRNTVPAIMPPMRYTGDLYAESCNIADVYAESIKKDIFNGKRGYFSCHSLRMFWAVSLQAVLPIFPPKRGRC